MVSKRETPPAAKKTILVTGGAGFLGSHIVRKLLSQGHNVICMDNFFSGARDNVKDLLSNPNFELMRHDVTVPFTLEVDRIYHMACPASPVHYQSNAIKTLKTNILGTLNVLGVAKNCGARVLLASTSEVYGDPEVHPQPEEYHGKVNPIGLRSCYDEGKRAAEALCMDYHRQHDVEVRIARIFNTYGPRMQFHDGRVVSNFMVQALQGEPLTVYGDGSQTRSLCYVDDLIEGLIALMESSQIGPMNIGNPRELSVLQIAQMVKQITGSTCEILHKSLPVDDPKVRCPDITKAQTLLNWEPKVPAEEGLKATYIDFKMRSEQDPSALYCTHQKGALDTEAASK